LKDTFVTKGSLVKICGSSSFSNTPWLATGLFICSHNFCTLGNYCILTTHST
jgi:hypothetical protein